MNNNSNIKGYVNSLESFGLVDGPGVRFVVFLQGCNMRCKYCHNPETWSLKNGQEWTPEDLFKRVYRYRNYWKNNGGITVSGGEPLLQSEFVTEFFKIAKAHNIHTTIDTAGEPFKLTEEYLAGFDQLMNVTDLFMLDLKAFDKEAHKALTGKSNKNILQMAKYLSDNNKDMWIRHVLVPDLTDDVTDLERMRDFISSLSSVKKVEILPYHTLGLSKWDKLKIPYSLRDKRPPNQELVKEAQNILCCENYGSLQ